MKPIDAVVHEMCRYLEAHAEEPLTLAALARRSGYSASHLQRRFSALVGSSPKAYQLAVRQRRLRHGLRRGAPLSEAIVGAGYGSQSRVYERLATTFGMTPGQYRGGGRGLEIRYASARTRLGRILLGATARGLCFLQFVEDADPRPLRAEFPRAVLHPMDPARAPQFAAWMRRLDAYLAGRSATLTLPLDLQGTAFQTMVWRCLQTIPAGQTRSYGEVAAAIGKPAAVRAAASACARNKVALVVPCHRVIRGSGDLGGYRWGPARKRALLALERPSAG
jgi:AraC family transcriptional regulator of adaptative response/methylated-DNA-[protein]-cysteine methyltransferase